MDLDTAVQISVAALGAGIAPIVAGAGGAVVDGDAAARRRRARHRHAACRHPGRGRARSPSYLRYPPQGHRSVAGGLPHLRYEKHSLRRDLRRYQRRDVGHRHAETPLAIANAEANRSGAGHRFAADRHQRSGDGTGHPRRLWRRAHRRAPTRPSSMPAEARQACRGSAASPTMRCIRCYIEMGVRLVLPGSDLSFAAECGEPRPPRRCAASSEFLLVPSIASLSSESVNPRSSLCRSPPGLRLRGGDELGGGREANRLAPARRGIAAAGHAARHPLDVRRRVAVSADERRGEAADRALSGARDRLGAIHRASYRHADRVPAAIRAAADRDASAAGAVRPLGADAGQQFGLRPGDRQGAACHRLGDRLYLAA